MKGTFCSIQRVKDARPDPPSRSSAAMAASGGDGSDGLEPLPGAPAGVSGSRAEVSGRSAGSAASRSTAAASWTRGVPSSLAGAMLAPKRPVMRECKLVEGRPLARLMPARPPFLEHASFQMTMRLAALRRSQRCW